MLNLKINPYAGTNKSQVSYHKVSKHEPMLLYRNAYVAHVGPKVVSVKIARYAN